MLLYVKLREEKEIMLLEKNKGYAKFCYNQIWNAKGTYKRSVLFEYDSSNSFKQCQTELSNFLKQIMKELQAIEAVVEASRNIVLQDLRV